MSIRLLAGVGVCALGAVAIAGPVKKAAPVPGQAALQRLVGELYAKKHSTTDQERILVRIDKVLSRDGKEQALKAPRFWARARLPSSAMKFLKVVRRNDRNRPLRGSTCFRDSFSSRRAKNSWVRSCASSGDFPWRRTKA